MTLIDWQACNCSYQRCGAEAAGPVARAAAGDAESAVQPPREPRTLGEEVQGLASAVWGSLGGREQRPVLAPPPRPRQAEAAEAADPARQLFLDALQKVPQLPFPCLIPTSHRCIYCSTPTTSFPIWDDESMCRGEKHASDVYRALRRKVAKTVNYSTDWHPGHALLLTHGNAPFPGAVSRCEQGVDGDVAQTAESCQVYGEMYDARRCFAASRLMARLDAGASDGDLGDSLDNEAGGTEVIRRGAARAAGSGGAGGGEQEGSRQQPGSSGGTAPSTSALWRKMLGGLGCAMLPLARSRWSLKVSVPRIDLRSVNAEAADLTECEGAEGAAVVQTLLPLPCALLRQGAFVSFNWTLVRNPMLYL